MVPFKFVLGVLVAALIVVHPVKSQEISSAPTQLALEVHFYPNQAPAYQTVPDSSPRGAWYARFARVPGSTQPANSLAVTAVNIKSLKAEEGVRVWVTVFLGELHEQEQKVSAYVLKEGDKISVAELAEVGVVPFEIKIVRLAATAAQPPQFRSKAKSIEVVSMQANFSATPSYEVVVRNTSGKPVSSLAVQTLQGGRVQLGTNRQGPEGQQLIAPGDSYRMTVRLANRAKPGADGYAPELLPDQTIEVRTAVFTDGTFEGDSEPAMAFTGFQIGRKIQLARVVGLLQNGIKGETGALNDPVSLKDALAALDLKADDAAIETLRRKFPQQHQTELTHVIEIGMKGIRDELLNELSQFELRNRRSDQNTFSAWLSTASKRYQAWLDRL
jgi:hypothetical protein